MTQNEMEMIELIRKSKNPEKALIVAIEILTNFLSSLEGGFYNA